MRWSVPRRAPVRALFVLALLAGCTRSTCNATSTFDAVIYGKDDRIEVSEAQADVRGAARSVGLLLSRSREVVCRAGSCSFTTEPVSRGLRLRLCHDEPFSEQPAIGSCTAFLVGPDLVATAGHCVRTASECADAALIFDFEMPQALDRPFVLPADDVYFCAKVEGAKDVDEGDDWALLRLDRPVAGRTPLCMRREGAPTLGRDVVLIGHPFSLPKKVSGGAQVKYLARSHFEANLDSIGGSSGAPVLDARTMRVEGVFVRGWDGRSDARDRRGECAASRWCSDRTGCEGGGFEDVNYIAAIAARVPQVPCYVPGSPEAGEPPPDDEALYSAADDAPLFSEPEDDELLQLALDGGTGLEDAPAADGGVRAADARR